MTLEVYTDTKDCQRIWERAWPVRSFSDLWAVRACFHDSFNRSLRFQTIEKNGEVLGLLPLSWCEDSGQYVFFPGETWHGKTWIEQNQIIATDKDVAQELIDAVPGPLHLRYLSWNPLLEGMTQAVQDEIGYMFYPGLYDYSFENYWLGFSGKSRKKIKTELTRLELCGVSFRFNQLDDLEHLFRLNTEAFMDRSYFYDLRFYNAFQRLASYLKEMGMLRMTTILIGGEIAAVDMGVVFNDTYTLLAGGTNPVFKGVAKLINLHHIEWACQKKIQTVDFLCGDFNWKERFHLSPRPLYQLVYNSSAAFRELKIHDALICA